MTTRGRNYPTRVACEFGGKTGQIVLDQMRTVDKRRLLKHLGTLDVAVQTQLLSTLAEMFKP